MHRMEYYTLAIRTEALKHATTQHNEPENNTPSERSQSQKNIHRIHYAQDRKQISGGGSGEGDKGRNELSMLQDTYIL